MLDFVFAREQDLVPHMGQIKSWEVSDVFWARVEPLIPPRQRDGGRAYRRRPGGGRKPMEARRIFEAIVYVLRTGIPLKALPRSFGSASAIHQYFQDWQRAGFFLKLWREGLAEYDAMEGIAWDWQSIDGAMHKAPLAQECSGANPTDRGKKRTQAQPAGGRAWRPALRYRQRSQRA
jgi:transposase